jgi:DNA repair protein RecN (Recombination protein N)
MLSWLRVSGFALIERVELSFGPGLTVITGETGAGKSILVEALALLRGGRASGELIRAGRDEAEVEAVFELPADSPVRAQLLADGRAVEAADGAEGGGGGLVVRRMVSRAGRGRAHLGGALATLAELGTSVGALVDITSQHDQQSLMDLESQLYILDTFAENTATVAEARLAWQALTEARAELEAFETQAQARAEREDYLRFQLGELDEAAPQPGEDEALKSERERVRGAEKFLAVFARGEEALYAGDQAAASLIAGAARELEALAVLDGTLAPLAERLRNAQAVVEDVASDLSRLASHVRFDPERLAQIEERLHLLTRLVRKHGGTLDSAIARRDAIARELEGLGSYDEGLGARKAAVAEAEARMRALWDVMAERRRKSARTLGKRIDETLRELGLREAAVKITVEDKEPPGPRGRDRVVFLFAPNAGEEPRPLARIASGGELSRVMLAVKRALARADRALTYVFDEVDTGVGGGTSEVIGKKLKAIAADRQVLVVTHLPQIAAFADHHLRVEKGTSNGRTTVHIEALDDRARSAELARMLGGAKPSREATAHADEMLRRART